MKFKKKINKNYKSGFTLIEIILVVVIIGILATIGIQNLGGKSDMANKVAAAGNINMLSAAITEYEMYNSVYPESLDNLLKCPTTGENLLSNGLIGIIILIYLLWVGKKIPMTITKLFKAKGLNSRFWNDL